MDPNRANADVTPSGGSRFRVPFRGGKLAIVLAILIGALAIGVAGVAYATYNYAKRYEGKILPGATVAGVDISGMERDEAIKAVRRSIKPQLDRTMTIHYGKKTFETTPRKLGASSDAGKIVGEALEASGRVSFLEKAGMRVLGDDLDFDRAVAIKYPKQGAKGYIAGIASNLDRDAVDAHIDSSSGWVKIVPETTGVKVRSERSLARLRKALKTGGDEVDLAVTKTKPEVTTDAFDKVLLVHIGENKLYLYEGGKITHSWTVATGQPEYPTPTGTYSVTEKRYMPTWINPAPDTWGASLPDEIPPGPGNPLGLRAINWSAPAIRFHGTEATYSLGYNASHGCVRMANEDVIQLYDMIDVGTPIVSVNYGSLRPLYVTTSTVVDPTPVSGDSSGDSTGKNADKGAGKGGN